MPRAARIATCAAGGALMLGGAVLTAIETPWGFLGLMFGVAGIAVGLAGGETYVHYPVVTPGPGDGDGPGSTLALAPGRQEG